MTRMRGLLGPILLSLTAILLLATPVFAYLYRAPLAIVESAATTYTMLPVMVTANNQWMSDNGFQAANTLDTRVETLGGAVKPHMVTGDRTLTAVGVPADSQTNLFFTTGNSDLTSLNIITGYDGYLTVSDVAGLEPGADFEIEIDGYVDTSVVESYPSVAGVASGDQDTDVTSHTVNLPASIESGNLLLVFFVSDYGSTNVITFPAGWVEMFIEENNAHGGAWYRIADGTEGTSITVTTSESQESVHTSYRITGYSGVPENGVATTGSSVNPNPPSLTSSWGNIPTLWFAFSGNDATDDVTGYPADYTDGVEESANGAGGVGIGTARRLLSDATENPGTFTLAGSEQWIANTIAIRGSSSNLVQKGDAFRTFISASGTITSTVYDSPPVLAEATGVSSGEHVVKTTYDGADLKIFVDDMGVAKDTTAWVGTVPANAHDWVLMSNTTPYWNSYQHTVGGSLITRFEPNTMIIGTTLPDREAAANDATIAWGANPAGVSVSLGSMTSSGQPSIGTTGTEPPRDILPTVATSDWFGDGSVSGATLTNPFRPFITMVSDNTTLDEIQVWRWMGVALLLGVTVATSRVLRGHLGITSIVASAILGALVAFDHNIFPFWLLVITIGGLIGGVIAERSPSL